MDEKARVKMPDIDLNWFDDIGPAIDKSEIVAKSSGGKFVKGNQFWRNVTAENLGRPNKFNEPQELLDIAIDYLDWLEANPLYEEMPVGKNGDLVDVKKMNAPTLEGFCVFGHFVMSTFQVYRKKPEYSAVISYIESAFFSISYAGAAARLLDGRIVATKLGLITKKEITSNINQKVLLYIPQSEAPRQLKIGEIEDVDFENT